MEVLLQGQGHTPDLIDAVLATGEVDVIDILERAAVLKTFRAQPDFGRVYPALNRVLRILPDPPPTEIQPDLFQDHTEKQLGKVVDAAEAELTNAFRNVIMTAF